MRINNNSLNVSNENLSGFLTSNFPQQLDKLTASQEYQDAWHADIDRLNRNWKMVLWGGGGAAALLIIYLVVKNEFEFAYTGRG